MEGASRIQMVQASIARDLLKQVERGATINNAVRMVGWLFARPGSALTKSDIFPNLNYFHYRSGDFITFYICGYSVTHRKNDAACVVDGRRWEFDDRIFDDLRRYIEGASTWTYSGAVDLILANASLWECGHETGADGKTRVTDYSASLDFSSALCANLEKMKAIGAIDSVETFFEDIFRHAERQDGLDPTWGFSDKQGMKVAGSALKHLVLSLLPEPLRKDVEKAPHFAIRNIKKDS